MAVWKIEPTFWVILLGDFFVRVGFFKYHQSFFPFSARVLFFALHCCAGSLVFFRPSVVAFIYETVLLIVHHACCGLQRCFLLRQQVSRSST